MKQLRRHFSFANAISCIALFVALSGAAYAATSIGDKAVKTRNLANGAVTATKLHAGAVATAKLQAGAVTRAKLPNEVITEAKLKKRAVGGNQIAGGAITDFNLAPDAVGAGKILDNSITAKELSAELQNQLVRNLSYVTRTSESNTTATKSIFAECPLNKKAIGGGAQVVGSTTAVAVTKSIPGAEARGWGATAQAIGPEPVPWAVEAFAVCAEA
jgi:hypothetical protein